MDAPGGTPPTSNPARMPEADAQLYLHPQTLARLGTLELRAKHIVEGVMSGAHRSPYQGYSVEFAQHRPYVPGDDIRHLDWKVFGRTDKLHLKQYQQETNLDLVLLVDGSGSMAYGSRSFQEASGMGQIVGPHGSPNWTKFDHATATAAAMAYICLRQGDRVGLVVFADDVLRWVKQSSAQGTWRQIVGALSTQTIDRPTDLPRVIDRVLGKVTSRCLFVLLSDLFSDPEAIKAAMSRLKFRGHDLIVAQVLDEAERTLALSEEAPLIGLEGEPQIRVDPRAIREAYLEALARHQDAVTKAALSFGFDFMSLSTHDWLGPPLSAFLARRNARLKKAKMG
jgi:uncharacterized protein (DUF58 family)